ncbi:hypothetical protein N7474_010579 [Penicillium riverlandense]|uniref:uncharacterized protein n=1 Tax=Penicillium riverlandense TaxID=1903569 RepID=UPI00254885ED|nr:uncharacterized protein N7474_010579 [Penicillium riverlandense]KAJ5806987.1 hypothetical protein N7474_010579 [Penicillium riverlandense]
MSISKPESDVILNRANVALARSQRLVASWLPAQTDEELTHVKSEEELQKEEDEIFTAVPETLGVGAPLPEKAADGSWNRTELGSNDKLRKQLLGKNYDKIMKAAAANQPLPSRTSPMVARNNTTSSAGQVQGTGNTEEENDEDEEEGRTALVGKKKTNKRRGKDDTSQDLAQDPAAGDAENKATPAAAVPPPSSRAASSKGKKKATSYLDEILAERAKKRKKR